MAFRWRGVSYRCMARSALRPGSSAGDVHTFDGRGLTTAAMQGRSSFRLYSDALLIMANSRALCNQHTRWLVAHLEIAVHGLW